MEGTDPTGKPYTPKTGYQTPDIVTEAVKRFDEAYHHHHYFVRNFDRRERAYRGILHATAQAARWRHTMHPPYAFNMIETIVAGESEQGMDTKVIPAPMPGLDMQTAQDLLEKAEDVRYLLKHERGVDGFDQKQRPLLLCDAIGGRYVGKSYWNLTHATVSRQGVHEVVIHDADGGVLGTVPTIVEIERDETLFDNSTTEVVDPRDFILHESARALQPREPGGAQYLFHRSWYSMEQLKQMEREGFLTNVDYLTNTQTGFSQAYTKREKELWRINRIKDLVEVVEYWYFWRGKVWRCIYGNRSVQLRAPESNPFWHQNYPFFIGSSQPQPFSTQGASDMELLEQIQEMLWELANQRYDNLELVNNAITLLRSDIDDPDVFQYYPGAFWMVDDPKQVQPYAPPWQLANVSLEAEALLKGDLQAVSSATPLAGGNDQGIGKSAQTATGASLIMTAAQQRLAYKKWHAQQGFNDEAWMRIKNCQQFMTDERLLHVIGPSGKLAFKSISPFDIQGEFLFTITSADASMNRQERRAEAQAIVQLMMNVFPQSYVSGTPIDLHEVIIWALREWDMEDEAEAFFQPKQQPDPQTVALLMGNAPRTQIRLQGTLAEGSEAGAIQEQGQLTGGGPGSPPQPNMGTTSSTAVDASKPSATGGLSMSPALMLQRARALSGGLKGGG